MSGNRYGRYGGTACEGVLSCDTVYKRVLSGETACEDLLSGKTAWKCMLTGETVCEG